MHLQHEQYFLDRVGELPAYGRASNRLNLACLLENFCCRDAYPLKDPPAPNPDDEQKKKTEKESSGAEEISKPVPLVVMPPDEWQAYARMLETVYDDMRRLDANAPILPETLAEQRPFAKEDDNDDDDDAKKTNKDPRVVAYNASLLNAAPNAALDDHREFTRKYREIEISLQFHRAMAGTMREVLEGVLATPGGEVADSESSDSEEDADMDEEEEVPEVAQEVLVEFQ